MPSEQQPKNPGGEFPRQHVSARVPDSIGAGVFASSAVVMATSQELVLDFLQTLVQPSQTVARVIVTWATVPNLTAALRKNLEIHDKRFGGKQGLGPLESAPVESPEQPLQQQSNLETPGVAVPAAKADGASTPTGSPATAGDDPPKGTRQVDAKSFYEDLRLDDEVLRGNYANGAMINHTEFEFKIDFLSTLAPHPIVTARVFLTAPQVRRLLESIEENEARRRRS